VVNESMLLGFLDHAKSSGLRTNVVADAGRTEVEPGTRTVGAIGPHSVAEIDAITGSLSLL